MSLSSINIPGVFVKENIPLADYTTFRLGGPCPLFIDCAKPAELILAVQTLIAQKQKFILIGGGSNLVVSDAGLDCAVIRYVSAEPQIEHHDDLITVSGSTALDQLALYSAEMGLEGLVYTSGIPGTVGGAIVGNAGAFGKQVGDALESVTLISAEAGIHEAFPKELGFTYRNSKLKETGAIVVSARFRVKPGDRNTLLTERAEILKIRHEKHPDLEEFPCAGSFFRNIEPTSKAERRQATGWFLEQAGGKSLIVGGAKIFEKHANIIVKGKGCTAKDVYQLSQKMAQLVKLVHGLDLVREVRFVGKFDGIAESERNIIW